MGVRIGPKRLSREEFMSAARIVFDQIWTPRNPSDADLALDNIDVDELVKHRES